MKSTINDPCEACGSGRCRYGVGRSKCVVPKAANAIVEHYEAPKVKEKYGDPLRTSALGKTYLHTEAGSIKRYIR